jgi:lysophospholipase
MTPEMTLVSIPANPVPEGAVAGTVKTPDGGALRFARFAPPPGRKGTLCLFHGRAEFIEKYFEVVQEARERGLAVATLDWRGQGLSQHALRDKRKGHVGDFSEYETDLETFMKEVVLPDCPPPFFALGHSMGATILIRAAYRNRRWFDRVVLSAPLIDLNLTAMPRVVHASILFARLLGLGTSYIPAGGATAIASQPFAGNPLTSDPVRYARTSAIIDAEPALGLGSPTIAWTSAAFRAMREFADPAYAARIRQPLLILAAGQDVIVSTAAIEQFAIRLRAGAHLVIPGARHEILMEQDRYRGQFWAAFDAFVPGSPLY